MMEPSSYASEKRKNGIKRIINAFGYSKTDWLPRTVMKAHFAKFFGRNLILIVVALFLDFRPTIKMGAFCRIVLFH